MTYWEKLFHYPTPGYTTYYWFPSQVGYYLQTIRNYIAWKTPAPAPIPNGSAAKPWTGITTPGAGQMTRSAAYNYSFTWHDPAYCAILVAPLTDTTGWARPIPPPTAPAEPFNFYIPSAAAGLQDYATTVVRRLYDWGVDFPLDGHPYLITLPNEAYSISLRFGNCYGLNSGNAIYFTADVPIAQSAIKFYGNNTYLSPRFSSTGQFYITCSHFTSSADQFIVVIDDTNISYLTIFRGSGL